MTYLRKPDWLKTKIYSDSKFSHVSQVIKNHDLHTICTSGRCPNQSECWSKGTATLMIAGDICTRSCKFCNTITGKPLPLDKNEPANVAESIHLMWIGTIWLTMVQIIGLKQFVKLN